MFASPACQCCNKPFGFFTWSYSCLQCNRIFCDDCLKPQRICKFCQPNVRHQDQKQTLHNSYKIICEEFGEAMGPTGKSPNLCQNPACRGRPAHKVGRCFRLQRLDLHRSG